MKRVISTKIFQNVKKINYFQRIYVKYWNNIKLFKDKENLLLWNNIYIFYLRIQSCLYQVSSTKNKRSS